jgi:hypothetical protein
MAYLHRLARVLCLFVLGLAWCVSASATTHTEWNGGMPGCGNTTYSSGCGSPWELSQAAVCSDMLSYGNAHAITSANTAGWPFLFTFHAGNTANPDGWCDATVNNGSAQQGNYMSSYILVSRIVTDVASPTCGPKAGQASGRIRFDTGVSGGFAFTTLGPHRFACDGGCVAEVEPDFGFVDFNYLRTSKTQWVEGPGKYTGLECNDQTIGDGLSATGTTPNGTATSIGTKAQGDPCPVGQLAGTVNSTTVCFTPAADVPTVKKTDASTTTTNPDGSTTTVTNTTTTTCTGAGSCSSSVATVTSSVPAAGGTATTTTTTKLSTCTTGTPGCSGTETASGFLGSCSGGFTCTGDAVMCATARAASDMKCSFFDKTSTEQTVYDSIKGAGTATGVVRSSVVVGSSSFDSSNALGVAGVCIPDLALTVTGRAFVLPMSQVCPYLGTLGTMMLAMAWLSAAFIVFRSKG